jgi:signal peptidase II
MPRLSSLQGSWQSQRVLFLVTLLVLAADQLSKLWVRENLLPGESVPKEGVLRLTYVTNEGIIFGLSAPRALSLIFPILVMAAVLFLYCRYTLFHSGLVKIALGLVIGGSLGNLVDRIRFGYVTDFIDFRLWGDFHWPAFNLADSALVIGIILFVYFWLRLKLYPKHG